MVELVRYRTFSRGTTLPPIRLRRSCLDFIQPISFEHLLDTESKEATIAVLLGLVYIILLTILSWIAYLYFQRPNTWFSRLDDNSDDDIETHEEPKTIQRERGLAISASVHGEFNEWRAAEMPIISKTDIQQCLILNTFRNSPFFKNICNEDLHLLCDVMSLLRVEDKTAIDFDDSLFILLEGRVVHNTTIQGPGAIYGETAMLHKSTPKSLVIAEGDCWFAVLTADVYQNTIICKQIRNREKQMSIMRNVKLLETLTDEQLMSLIDVMQKSWYEEGKTIVKQGTPGKEFFVVQKGSCEVTVTTGSDVQTVTEYHEGDLFGELALLNDEPRAATITAKSHFVEVLSLSRHQFERFLGPIGEVIRSNYIKDPRKIIADFYLPGDENGPLGSIAPEPVATARPAGLTTRAARANKLKSLSSLSLWGECESHWFAVYRPTSRDAIQKMLAGIAVGKGLNIKGKSAKKGYRSGYVPFLQIYDDSHKAHVEASPADAQVYVYFRTLAARDVAIQNLEKRFSEGTSEYFVRTRSQVTITCIDHYQPASYGICVSEHLVREAYIMRPCLTPPVGWETGRNSQPAFMNMNLHALREDSKPKAVLFQIDEANPLNPHGLLMAYAEDFVKPVVSDFDTFVVGARDMKFDSLPPEQVKVLDWTLTKTSEILKRMNRDATLNWTEAWLALLETELGQGLTLPDMPEFGWGDPVSTRLTGDVVRSTIDCGAVRHGAENFNLTMPCELDDEYLIVWEHFPEQPWSYVTEPELRTFILDRIKEGYVLPINPVWALRDAGWYDILTALRASPQCTEALQGWFPGDMLERVDAIYHEITRTRSTFKRVSLDVSRADLSSFENMELNLHELRRKTQREGPLLMPLSEVPESPDDEEDSE